jgi:hypothetical protein
MPLFLSTLKNMVRSMVEAGRTVEEITGMLGGPQAADVRRWAEEAVKAQRAVPARQEAAE